jgi:hypothetical protein
LFNLPKWDRAFLPPPLLVFNHSEIRQQPLVDSGSIYTYQWWRVSLFPSLSVTLPRTPTSPCNCNTSSARQRDEASNWEETKVPFCESSFRSTNRAPFYQDLKGRLRDATETRPGTVAVRSGYSACLHISLWSWRWR